MSRPRRLVVFSPTGLVSGAEHVLLRVVAAAVAAGWEVVCLAPGGELANRARAFRVTVVRTPDLKFPRGPRAWGALVVGLRSVVAARLLRRAAARADAVLVNSILCLPAVCVARPAAPTGWLVHDVIHRRDWRALLRACGRCARESVAVSEAAAGPLRELGLPVRVIRNGVEWPVEPAPLEQKGPPVVGCTGLLTSWKGQDVLLDAVARLPRSDVVVELVGGSFPKDAPYVETLRRRAEQPDLAGRVRFLGRLDDVLERIRTWSVAVSASVDPEAGPIVLVEYLSVGVPCVATDHGGAPELIGDGGLLVPPRDAGAMSTAIQRLLDDEDLRRRCAAAGPRIVAAGLTVEHFSRALLDFLDELAGARP